MAVLCYTDFHELAFAASFEKEHVFPEHKKAQVSSLRTGCQKWIFRIINVFLIKTMLVYYLIFAVSANNQRR